MSERELRRYDTATLRPPDLELTIGKDVYIIRGNLDVDTWIAIFELDERAGALKRGQHKELAALCRECIDLVHELIKERYPDAPRPKMGLEEAMGTLGFLAGGEAVSTEVAEAIAGGKGADSLPGNRAERRAESKTRKTRGGGADAAPLRSRKPSQKRS